jgi:hypothetical protein
VIRAASVALTLAAPAWAARFLGRPLDYGPSGGRFIQRYPGPGARGHARDPLSHDGHQGT